MNNESKSSQEANFMSHNHLKWIYDRLIHVHGENPNFDYMIKFKSEIEKVAACRQSIAELINALEALNSYAPDFPESHGLGVFDLGLRAASKNAESAIERAKQKINPPIEHDF